VLAGGILLATAVSLWSALGGLSLLIVTILATGALADRLLSRTHSLHNAMIHAGGVVVAGAIVTLTDASMVPLLMPVLGASALTLLTPRKRCAAART
jgi:hypothetical protein